MEKGNHSIKLNGETWRFITPILIVITGGISTFGLFMMQDIKTDTREIRSTVKANHEKFFNHVNEPTIHWAMRKDVDWIIKTQDKNENS